MLGRFTTVEGAAAAYKTAKEAEIKRVAEEYRDVLDIRAYKALVKFQVK